MPDEKGLPVTTPKQLLGKNDTWLSHGVVFSLQNEAHVTAFLTSFHPPVLIAPATPTQTLGSELEPKQGPSLILLGNNNKPVFAQPHSLPSAVITFLTCPS